jgi:hypothetical protein
MEIQSEQARPRAYYPDYVNQAPTPARTPGWDLAGPERNLADGRTAARMMGWFSLGLGAAEVLAPKRVTSMLGVSERHAPLVVSYGLREIASGVGVLSDRTPATGMWSRVAGDALDLATLGVALRASERRRYVIAAMGFVAAALAADAFVARKLSQHRAAAAQRRPR